MQNLYFMPELIDNKGRLDVSNLPTERDTFYISVCGQDGSGKTSLRDNLAKHFAEKGKIVITSKSPSDKYIVGLLNNAISQNGYEDWYTEQLLFSFSDGLLSNYMEQLDGHTDLFICQRGPSDQYDHGITRSRKTYEEIHDIQRPERLKKFDIYFHLNANAEVAWQRIADDEGKDRYEYPEYFKRQVVNTKKLYDEIVYGNNKALEFLRSSHHFYIDTTELSIEQTFERAIKCINSYMNLKFDDEKEFKRITKILC